MCPTFRPINYLNILKVTFPQTFRLLLTYVYHIAKKYLSLIQQIADLLTKIDLVRTLLLTLNHSSNKTLLAI